MNKSSQQVEDGGAAADCCEAPSTAHYRRAAHHRINHTFWGAPVRGGAHVRTRLSEETGEMSGAIATIADIPPFLSRREKKKGGGGQKWQQQIVLT